MDFKERGKLRAGDRVKILCPENERIHNSTGKVKEVTQWGAHILTEAAATGRYGAGWEEIEKMEPHVNGSVGKDHGFTGDFCPNPNCGSSKMVRSGSCLCCLDCGQTTGCS